jgi:hypothetical protein
MKKVLLCSVASFAIAATLMSGLAQIQTQAPLPLVPEPLPLAPATTVPPAVLPEALAPATNAPAFQAPADGAKAEKAKPAAKPKPKVVAPPSVRGKIEAIDRTEMTLSVEAKGKAHLFRVTSNTRFFRESKPATFAEAMEGEEVTVIVKSLKPAKPEALTVRYVVKAGDEGIKAAKPKAKKAAPHKTAKPKARKTEPGAKPDQSKPAEAAPLPAPLDAPATPAPLQ